MRNLKAAYNSISEAKLFIRSTFGATCTMILDELH